VSVPFTLLRLSSQPQNHSKKHATVTVSVELPVFSETRTQTKKIEPVRSVDVSFIYLNEQHHLYLASKK